MGSFQLEGYQHRLLKGNLIHSEYCHRMKEQNKTTVKYRHILIELTFQNNKRPSHHTSNIATSFLFRSKKIISFDLSEQIFLPSQYVHYFSMIYN